MYKLNVDRLVKDELEFEIKIRGIKPSGTVESLKKCLRSLLRLEQPGDLLQSSIDLDVEEEIAECTRKLTELKESISNFSGTNSQVSKIETRFAHLVGRIKLISGQETEFREKRSILLTEITCLMSDYETKARLLSSNTAADPPLNPDFVDNSAVGDLNSLANATMADENGALPNVNRLVGNFQQLSTNSNFKSVPVYKWGIRFSGSSNLSFNAFLQRVEELCISRGVNKNELFQSASDLFEANALNYYHLICKYATDWDSLIKLMRDEFVPANFGDTLWNQILNRTQGSDEPIGIYVAAMTQLFDRMPSIVTDNLRLKVLRNNMLPFYQERLSLHEIGNPFELIEFCRKLEETRSRVEEFKPPKKGNVSLEPDLDYQPLKRDFSKPVVTETNVGSFSSSDSFRSSDFRNNSNGRDFDRNVQNKNGQHSQNKNYNGRSFNRNGDYKENVSQQEGRYTNSFSKINGSRNFQNNSQNFKNFQNFDNSPNNSRDKQSNSQTFYSRDQNRSQSSNVQLCFKCNQPNHFAKNCTAQVKKCFNCGKVNFTKRTCPNCNKENFSQGNDSRNQS